MRSKAALAKAITCGAGDIGGPAAGARDGTRVIFIELEMEISGRKLPAFAFTLAEAGKLRDWLNNACAREAERG